MGEEIVRIDSVKSSRQFDSQIVVKFVPLAVYRVSIRLGSGHGQSLVGPKWKVNSRSNINYVESPRVGESKVDLVKFRFYAMSTCLDNEILFNDFP